MPIPKEIFSKLVKGEFKPSRIPRSDYLDKLPTLQEEEFPDNMLILDLTRHINSEKLHEKLKNAGLEKGQRIGVSNLLNCFCKLGDEELTLGDIRALTVDELAKLQGQLSYGKPSIDSILKIKKLLG